MSTVTVILSPSEMWFAAMVGTSRCIKNIGDGIKDKNVKDDDEKLPNRWTLDIEGAMGEMAVAKDLGMFWSGAIGNLRAKDVGPFQVRTVTSDARGGNLLIQRDDPDGDAFILVLCDPPRCVIVGWLDGTSCKQEKWWAEKVKDRPCYFVPPSALRPYNTLREWKGRRK